MLDKAELPNGWRIVRLGDVAFLRKKQVEWVDNDPRLYIALEHISPAGSLNGRGTASESVSHKTAFQEGDTLYGKLRPNLRKIIRADFDGVCSAELLAIFAGDSMDGAFLSHTLRSDPLHRHAMRGIAGTKMPRTSWSHLRAFQFPCPPPSEQRAIAAVLDSIDEAIERTEAVIAATKRLRDALLHELLTRGLPGQHTEFKQVLGVGIIPARWKVVRLGDVANVTFSSVDKKTLDDEIAVQLCNYTDVFYNRRIRTEMDFMTATATRTELERWSLKRGDVLFTKDSETPDEIGVPSVVTEDMPNVLCGYHLGLARPRVNAIKGEFLTEALRSQASRREFARVANGVTRFGLTLNTTHSLPVVLPPFVEQCAIAGLLERADEVIDHTRAERSALQALKAAASEALLTGGVRVSCGTEIVH